MKTSSAIEILQHTNVTKKVLYVFTSALKIHCGLMVVSQKIRFFNVMTRPTKITVIIQRSHMWA